MAFQVEFTKSAKKEFDRLPSKIRQQVSDALLVLSTNPRSDILQIKKLKGEDSLFRIRLGDYRVLYSIERKILTVVVIKIGHRQSVYK